MRVIAGKAKGRKLVDVPGAGTRPITDRAKVSLFNIVGPEVAGSRFLDLFSGTGQVAIEALSRGALAAVLIESARRAVSTIQENLAKTGLAVEATVIRADVFEFLEREGGPFDYVFVAPPQYKGLWAKTLESLDAKPRWLASDAWVIVQIHPREFTDLQLRRLELFDRRTYGSVMLCFYSLRDPTDELRKRHAALIPRDAVDTGLAPG